MKLLPILRFLRATCFILLLGSFPCVVAQSTDIAAPAAVRSNEVEGTIAARDLGDPRLTDHYFAFSGTPGDVMITVNSQNLNGDIDVFTFSGLQPLLKFTVYAGSSSPITKSIYLRKQEDLILRIEGRTPNDEDAVYRIRFGGSFAPITSGPLVSENGASETPSVSSSTGKKGRRVSSVGARIYEPPAEVATAPTPEPTPAAGDESGETRASREAEPKPAVKKPNSRTSRTRVPVPRRPRPATPKPEDSAAKTDADPTASTEQPETENKPSTATKRPARRSTTARTANPVPAQEPEDSGPRLLIETNDGTFVDRYMSTVRRVTVENGQVVVLGKDGKIQRIPLSAVVRMTISP